VHHALAFNTLLSSQETDAFTVTHPVALASLCRYSFSLRGPSQIDSFRESFGNFHRPVSRATPQTYADI
ncbi:hypothetical protein, partial [Nonomuraea africana]